MFRDNNDRIFRFVPKPTLNSAHEDVTEAFSVQTSRAQVKDWSASADTETPVIPGLEGRVDVCLTSWDLLAPNEMRESHIPEIRFACSATSLREIGAAFIALAREQERGARQMMVQ
jgi:hypothetical protein